ncbi:arginine deiminase-related protein [Agarilytica rhodophyticola]|uniref:arginine deiminase-related protein n=1 Tax=Agarilytica rhodophyticola TaxID=1737490 RepID=UPI000B341AF0|nr:arginine deiminase-related protein [Agarilytica rhodophyticola]
MAETPSQLATPCYVMSYPHTLSNEVLNNVWMVEKSKEYDPEEFPINKPNSYRQFQDLYNFIASASMVYLMPSAGNFQDRVYVANLGIYLPHIKNANHIIMANFKSEPRVGEEKEGKKFFEMMGYEVHDCPYHWEGEADLKYLSGSTYIGGYGQRTDKRAYEWMADKFDMNIIPVGMLNEHLYHLDCSIFPIGSDTVVTCAELFTREEIRSIENYAQIIDVDKDVIKDCVTNSVRMRGIVMCGSDLMDSVRSDPWYEKEKIKVETVEKICFKLGLEPAFFNLSEFDKSGAALSCLVMRLNYNDVTSLR